MRGAAHRAQNKVYVFIQLLAKWLKRRFAGRGFLSVGARARDGRREAN